jgi:hypothetical protein
MNHDMRIIKGHINLNRLWLIWVGQNKIMDLLSVHGDLKGDNDDQP